MKHEEFEAVVLAKLLSGDHPDLITLRQQLSVASIARRDWTDTGVRVHFSIPRASPRASRSAAILDDVRLILSRDVFASVDLRIKGGKITVLECMRGDGRRWPEEPEIQTLDYYGSESRDQDYVKSRLAGTMPENFPARTTIFKMEIGRTYNVVFSTGRYEIEYANSVKCIKKTPKAYRIEWANGSTRLVGQNSIMGLKEVGQPCSPSLGTERPPDILNSRRKATSTKHSAEALYQDWISSIRSRRLKLNSLSAYEQAFRRFSAFLASRGVSLNEVRAAHVSDFVLDRYLRGNSKVSIEHFVDCVRQFFKHHQDRLKVRPSIFSANRVRKAYYCFERSGISKDIGYSDALPATKLFATQELKSDHSQYHPRG